MKTVASCQRACVAETSVGMAATSRRLHDLRYITALLSELVISGTVALLFELDFQIWSPGVGKLMGGDSILTRDVWVWC